MRIRGPRNATWFKKASVGEITNKRYVVYLDVFVDFFEEQSKRNFRTRFFIDFDSQQVYKLTWFLDSLPRVKLCNRAIDHTE